MLIKLSNQALSVKRDNMHIVSALANLNLNGNNNENAQKDEDES